jgi:hypothetical protein
MNHKTIIALTWVAMSSVSPSDASVLIAFPSTNTPDELAPTELAEGLQAINLRRGNGLSAATGTTFNSKHWSESSLANAIMAEDYLAWGLSSNLAFKLDQLSLRYDRSLGGPQQLAVQLSLNDGVTYDTIWLDTEVADDSSDFHEIDLSSWQESTQARFRMVGWKAAGLAGTFDIENYQSSPVRSLTVTGSIPSSPVPELSAVQIWGVGALGLLLLHGWFSRAQYRGATPMRKNGVRDIRARETSVEAGSRFFCRSRFKPECLGSNTAI